MFQSLTRKYGPLPGWAWGLIVIGVAYLYISYRDKQNAANTQNQQAQGLSTNLQCVPVSNLTTAAQPMPIQLGDTFVNTGSGGGVTQTGTPNTTVLANGAGGDTLQPASTPQPSPATTVQNIC